MCGRLVLVLSGVIVSYFGVFCVDNSSNSVLVIRMALNFFTMTVEQRQQSRDTVGQRYGKSEIQ